MMKRRHQNDEKNKDGGFSDFGEYMDAKITKLEEQFLFVQSDVRQKSNIFDGISIFVNGHTNPTAEELKRIMSENGGMFHHYQRSHTKFIIANNLPDVKIRQYNSKHNIVKSDWISDCLKAGRLLDYSPYLLVTNINRQQPKISFQNNNNTKATIVKSEIETKLKHDDDEEVFNLNLQALNEKLVEENEQEKVVKVEVSSLSSSTSSAARTAVDPNFLQEFFNNSRLHHIATLGADFKYLMNNLRKNHDKKFPARDELKLKMRSRSCRRTEEEESISTDVIMHIDMDCFFVSVSLRKHPHLRNHPVAVTHSKGKKETTNGQTFNSMSEIASCSYEARAKGLKNGMFVGRAMQLCPDLKTIPYDFVEYRETAIVLYNTVAKYTIDIEAVSCDELYADLKSLLQETEVDVNDFAAELRKEIFDATGCTCSVGIGQNRLQARMATKKAKPNGHFSLLAEDVKDYMKNIPISDLPGVGPNIAYQLKQLQVETCEQLQKFPLQTLHNVLGKKLGENLHLMSHGIDNKKLVYEHIRKSVSVEVNYGIRFTDYEQVSNFLRQMSDELSKRLREIDKKGKLLTLKLMLRAENASVETKKFMGHGEVDKLSKSTSLLSSINDSVAIFNNTLKLMKAFNCMAEDLRGIGLQMTKLDEEKTENVLVKMFEVQQKKYPEKIQPQVKVETSPPGKVVVSGTSPVKKSRGRPPKFTRKPSNSKLTTNSIEELFTKKKSALPYQSSKIVEKIDPDVLAQLPSDIVEEIMREYQMPEENSLDDTKSTISDSDFHLESSVANENLFYDENWRQNVISILSSSENFCETLERDILKLIQFEDINLLHDVMKFMRRKVFNENDCGGECSLDLYRKIYSKVQAEMTSKYSKVLIIN